MWIYTTVIITGVSSTSLMSILKYTRDVLNTFLIFSWYITLQVHLTSFHTCYDNGRDGMIHNIMLYVVNGACTRKERVCFSHDSGEIITIIIGKYLTTRQCILFYRHWYTTAVHAGRY